MRRIVVLRPEPDSSATVARARESGLDAVASPLFEIERVDWTVPDAGDFNALLLTSANAVRQAGPNLSQLLQLPVHAVGAATADAARAIGFEIGEVGRGGVRALLSALRPGLRLLHLCGEHRTAVGGSRQTITAIPVYRSSERGEADISDAGGAIVLVHSRRAARRFAQLAEQAGHDRATVTIAAISRGVAEAAGGGWQSVDVAREPSDEALLALASRLCNISDPT
jgi:uroporphyrinogen-III synthase